VDKSVGISDEGGRRGSDCRISSLKHFGKWCSLCGRHSAMGVFKSSTIAVSIALIPFIDCIMICSQLNDYPADIWMHALTLLELSMTPSVEVGGWRQLQCKHAGSEVIWQLGKCWGWLITEWIHVL
jgi:hypothetical protein